MWLHAIQIVWVIGATVGLLLWYRRARSHAEHGTSAEILALQQYTKVLLSRLDYLERSYEDRISSLETIIIALSERLGADPKG